MTEEQWERLKTVFQGALDQPPAERRGWLVRACEGDQALLAEAEALLHSHDTAGDFLEHPAVVDPHELMEPSESQTPEESLEPKPEPWGAGTRLGAYEILEELGRGGMGVVYLAKDARLGRLVALKSLPAAIANRADLRERLRREARASATIAHPSVATIYALDEIDGHLLLISEYVRGPTLRSLIERGPIDPVHSHAIAIDVARALEAAHQAGVIHRDLKPENVIVSADGGIKVVDFGIAHIEGTPMSRLTRDGAAIGTPAYMAPEQLLGGPVDARTDIYSFGLVVLEMLSGRHPMAAGPSPDTKTDGARPALVAIAHRCANAAPAGRYETARELLDDLERDAPTGIERVNASPHSARTHARWWWEFHQGAAAVGYAAILVPAWRARETIGGTSGRVVFIAAAAAVIVAALLRLHLWFTSRFYASELDWVRARARRLVQTADWMLVASLAAAALLIGERSVLDVVLVAIAIGTTVAFLVIEPATARAAFGGPPPS